MPILCSPTASELTSRVRGKALRLVIEQAILRGEGGTRALSGIVPNEVFPARQLGRGEAARDGFGNRVGPDFWSERTEQDEDRAEEGRGCVSSAGVQAHGKIGLKDQVSVLVW
jgi:hypothetical protein